MSNIPNIPNHVPTPLEVQEQLIRSLNKVLLMQIKKDFETSQDKVRDLDFMIKKIRLFVLLLVSKRPIPVPKKYNNAFDVKDYLEKGIATHVMLYSQIGFLNPLVVINVFIHDLNRNFNLIN